MRNRERERQRHRHREKQAPCREPDAGLDPGSPRSRPGLSAVLNTLSYRGFPIRAFNSQVFLQAHGGVMRTMVLFSFQNLINS